jgi:hypothetical protein
MKPRSRALRAALFGGILVSSLAMHDPLFAGAGKSTQAAAGPDAELKEFELGKLEARLGKIQPGSERDYFAGMLANRTGRIAESIRLLNGALPALRESNPSRA